MLFSNASILVQSGSDMSNQMQPLGVVIRLSISITFIRDASDIPWGLDSFAGLQPLGVVIRLSVFITFIHNASDIPWGLDSFAALQRCAPCCCLNQYNSCTRLAAQACGVDSFWRSSRSHTLAFCSSCLICHTDDTTCPGGPGRAQEMFCASLNERIRPGRPVRDI